LVPVDEHLAIKTDKVGDWSKKKEQVAAKDLAPRESDGGRKSSWAHCSEPLSEVTSAVLTDPQKATCELQALALFIFEQRRPAAPRRNKILGVSLRRSALKPALIEEDNLEHPNEAYASTHRSLLLEEEGQRLTVAAEILAGDYFVPWRYTRDQMADLLEKVLDGGFIAPEFRSDARSLLLEWRS
jgi:hypothetical protein